MYKKASFYSLILVVIGFVILTAAMFIMLDKKKNFQDSDGFFTVGSKQLKLLDLYHKGESALLYTDLAARYSASQSYYDLSLNGGYSGAIKCGSYLGYPIWLNVSDINQDCFPDLKESFKMTLQSNLNERLSEYPEAYFPLDNFEFSLNKTTVIGIALEPIQIIREYVSGIGDPADKDNQIQQCTTGDCIGKRAEYYAKLYEPLPYVYGGESPYTYDVSVKDQVDKGSGSIFYGVGLTKYQPTGTGVFAKWSGRLTTPGFDCTGFMWWVLKHSGIDAFYRASANETYKIALKEKAVEICSLDSNIKCTKRNIRRYAEPGDLVFIDVCEPNKICHAAIYVGDNKIAHSTGSSGPALVDIPDSFYAGGEYEIHSIYRPNYAKYANRPAHEQIEEPIDDENIVTYDLPIEPVESFQYNIRPSFKIETDFDFDIFEEVFGLINGTNVPFQYDGLIIETLKCKFETGQSLEYCIAQEILELNTVNFVMGRPLLSLDCDKGDEKLFYNFVEGYLDCLQTEDDNCVCNYSVDFQPGFEEGEYTVLISASDDDMIITLEASDHSYVIPDNQLMEAYGFEYVRSYKALPEETISLYNDIVASTYDEFDEISEYGVPSYIWEWNYDEESWIYQGPNDITIDPIGQDPTFEQVFNYLRDERNTYNLNNQKITRALWESSGITLETTEGLFITQQVNNVQYDVGYKADELNNAYLYLDDDRFSEDEDLFLFKNSMGNIGFLPRQELEKLEDYRACQAPEKNIFRFCASTNRFAQVFDEEDEKIQKKEIIIRFAVDFQTIGS